MNEPDNHTAWSDRGGDTWVRADDMPGAGGNWWPLTDGPGWDEWARTGVGQSRTWDLVEEYGPFVQVDAAAAIERVRAEAAR